MQTEQHAWMTRPCARSTTGLAISNSVEAGEIFLAGVIWPKWVVYCMASSTLMPHTRSCKRQPRGSHTNSYPMPANQSSCAYETRADISACSLNESYQFLIVPASPPLCGFPFNCPFGYSGQVTAKAKTWLLQITRCFVFLMYVRQDFFICLQILVFMIRFNVLAVINTKNV